MCLYKEKEQWVQRMWHELWYPIDGWLWQPIEGCLWHPINRISSHSFFNKKYPTSIYFLLCTYLRTRVCVSYFSIPIYNLLFVVSNRTTLGHWFGTFYWLHDCLSIIQYLRLVKGLQISWDDEVKKYDIRLCRLQLGFNSRHGHLIFIKRIKYGINC